MFCYLVFLQSSYKQDKMKTNKKKAGRRDNFGLQLQLMLDCDSVQIMVPK